MSLIKVKILENIVGQPQVVSILEKAIQASRKSEDDNQEMTHSWLFTGPSGSGKTLAAKLFAAALVCPNNGCGDCIDCKTAMSGTHLDIDIVEPEGTSIRIDEIRDLISRTSTTSVIGNWRIVLLLGAERLTEAAGNALLKRIEEPSSRTIWILCSPSIMDILPTIRSRCRNLNFRFPDRDEAVKFLISRYQSNLELAQYCFQISRGDLGKAILYSQDQDSRAKRTQIVDIVVKIKNVSSAFFAAAAIIELANRLAEKNLEEKENDKYILYKNKELERIKNKNKNAEIKAFEDILTEISYWQIDLIFSKLNPTSMTFKLAPELKSLENSKNWEISQLIFNIWRIEQLRNDLRNNGSPLIHFENFALGFIGRGE